MRITTRHPIAAALVVGATVLFASPSSAGEWTFRLEPMLMDASGHDQHVLDIHEIRTDAIPMSDMTTAVRLDTDSGYAFHGEVRYASGGDWTWGADVTVFYTDQSAADRTGAGTGPDDRVVFEVADRSFVSADPDDILLYTVLEDTSLQTWTVDLYALRALSSNDIGSLELQLGIRTADFDNDYRAVVGIQDNGGRRLDASSNYDRMMGPMVGFVGRIVWGRSVFEGTIAQSVLFGSVELTSSAREFTGPLGAALPVEAELPTVTAIDSFRATEDVAIPVTDVGFSWTVRVARWLALGAGVTSSTWWDVPVPPGVVPTDSGLQTLHKNTIVFYGVSVIAEMRF